MLSTLHSGPPNAPTRGGTDPDEFRGPGGLTARQIFQAVQESKERDAATAADFFVAAATASKESNYKDPT
eukprot:2257097-Ditylum_brightwellii.AAC.1